MIRALICLLSKQKVEQIHLLSSSPHLRMLKANFSFLDLRSSYLFFLVLYLQASLTNLSNLNVSKCGVLTMHFAPHEFVPKWSAFISTVIGEHQPYHILIQFLTNQFFHQLIKHQCPVGDIPIVPVQQQGLTYVERNALRYTAGAICHTLKKHLSKSNHPSKKDLMIGIDDLSCDDDEKESESDAKEWVELVDRGGYVTSKTKLTSYFTPWKYLYVST